MTNKTNICKAVEGRRKVLAHMMSASAERRTLNNKWIGLNSVVTNGGANHHTRGKKGRNELTRTTNKDLFSFIIPCLR